MRCDEIADDDDDFDLDDFDDSFDASAFAEDATLEDDNQAMFPKSHPAVEVTSFFPSNENDEFPAGEVVELLVGFRVKDADLPFNVSAVYVTLNDPNNHFNYVQNFTVAQYHMPVKTNSEQTVSYSFIPHPSLDANQYQLEATVFYTDEVRPARRATFPHTHTHRATSSWR